PSCLCAKEADASTTGGCVPDRSEASRASRGDVCNGDLASRLVTTRTDRTPIAGVALPGRAAPPKNVALAAATPITIAAAFSIAAAWSRSSIQDLSRHFLR